MGEITTLKPRTEGAGACGQHYVRVTCADHRGFVEFQFSIGDPNLYLEMTLPPAAFAEFCAHHQVVQLRADEAAEVDRQTRRWRFGQEDEE